MVTSESNKKYKFNIFSNNGESSSIYTPNMSEWKSEWKHVLPVGQINLTSTTIEKIITDNKWDNIYYDLFIDVQGAELEVLKGFNINNFKYINKIKIETSKKEFYNGGVLFPELNTFLINKGYTIESNPTDDHCDVIYNKL